MHCRVAAAIVVLVTAAITVAVVVAATTIAATSAAFVDSLAIRYGLRCAQGAFLKAGMYATNPLQWCMG